jgi:hypothetical protein
MPEEPPAARRVRKRIIIRMATEKMTIVTTISDAICRGKKGLRQIDLNEVPARAKSAGRAVGDEEEFVRGQR